MKAIVEIYKFGTGYQCEIKIQHDLFSMYGSMGLYTKEHKSKGQLKRKVIQFCSQLNLDIEWI